jgi:hypothetical protein
MAECPDFDVVLARLIERRGLYVGAMAEQTGIPESKLQAVLGGATPNEAQIRRLAPALGMHEADLFAIAWMDVPEDLAPLDPRAAWLLPHLAGHAARLSPEQVRELRERVSLMPQEERTQPTAVPEPYERPERSPGGVLLRLFVNRNVARRAAYAIMAMTGRGLSPSTVWMAGHGRKELSCEELADYIAVLDISTADMSIVTGVDLPDPVPRHYLGTTEAARLIWDVRRLSDNQVRHVRETAEFLGRGLGEAPAS